MLEQLVLSALCAVGVSFAVNFLMHWTTRVTVRRLTEEVLDLSDSLLSEKRKRAASASVDARATRASAFDAEMIKKHAPQAAAAPDDAPWWGKLAKLK